MYRSALLTSLFALSCATTSKDADSGAAVIAGPPIEATVRILDATSGGGVADVSVENSAGEATTTNSAGTATVTVPGNSTFEILLQKDGFIDHILFGPTAEEDFEYVTFLASQTMVDMVLSMMSISPGPDTGVVIVGIDYDDLRPAVGASASIDAAHDNPWVISGSMMPMESDTILAGGMGMVAFSSVPPGDVSVSVTPPADADCTAFPGGGEMPKAPVAASQVTVVTFHCR